ncbi:hypothetical protein WA026_006324 [Henosepilachna vigintioctopunctata]|uniref:Uncharacterized protein n=1 Tax=Henosepilachna vigintioctopunctata TaxID=420089 RepID=A0AAW1TSW1_9CUCU
MIDGRNWSSLLYCAYLGMESFKLLTNSVDPNLSNARGDAPLHFARMNEPRSIGLIKALLENGASDNIPDVSGKPPIDIALAKRTRFTTVFKCLAKHLIIQYCCGFAVNLRGNGFNSDILVPLREFDMGSSILGSRLLRKCKAAAALKNIMELIKELLPLARYFLFYQICV